MPEDITAVPPSAETAPPTTTPLPMPPASTPAPAANPDRPAWLPEGFDTPEALAAAYAELKTGTQPEPSKDKPEEKSEPAKADEAVSKFVADTGLDPAALSREIVENGDISAEAKTALSKKLEAIGLPPSMIDEYISGQKAVRDAAVQDVMAVAGGEKGYNEMAAWAQENLSEAELRAYSNLMMTADIDTAKLTVGNLYARYKSTAAIPGARLKGVTGAASGDVYRSTEQLREAMRDPRYSKDEAYRNDIMAKISRTRKAGIAGF